MNIFILEDELYHRQRLEKTIKEVTMEDATICKNLFSTAKPERLLNQINEKGNHQIYFLDIEIKDSTKKGLEVAKEIREKDPYGTIVFITTHSEFASLTFSYKVSALDFIAKDQEDIIFRKRIRECIQFVYQNQGKTISEDSFSFENNHRRFQIPFSEILYFETSNQPHKVILITKKQRIEFYSNLSEIEKKDHRLCKCHKSFVVNLANVTEVNKTDKNLFFENGESCFISRRKLKYVIDWLSAN